MHLIHRGIVDKHYKENLLNSFKQSFKKGYGIDVITGKEVDMINFGIVDPVLVTKTALKNAVSVATTIFSADCVINNIRVENASS